MSKRMFYYVEISDYNDGADYNITIPAENIDPNLCRLMDNASPYKSPNEHNVTDGMWHWHWTIYDDQYQSIRSYLESLGLAYADNPAMVW